MYGGGSAQYPMYGSSGSSGLVSGGAATAAAAAYYPYLNMSEGTTGYSGSGGGGYGVQYPHQQHLFQYSQINSNGIYPPHYGTPVSLAPQTPLQSGN